MSSNNQVALDPAQIEKLIALTGGSSEMSHQDLLSSVIERLEIQARQAKHLSKLGQIAIEHGFKGDSGAAMLEFVGNRMVLCTDSVENLGRISNAAQKLRLPSEKDRPMGSVVAVIDEAASRIRAQQATIEILVQQQPSLHRKP